MAQASSKTCEICVSANGSQYCLECEQFFCENCKTFHSRQKISKSHQFQSSSDVIPEGKSKCKDHNEDVYFVCNTCNEVVCSSCVTGSHKGHDFSKLMDSITELKEKITQDLSKKVDEATLKIQNIEEGLQEFDLKEEVVIKAITEDGTKRKDLVDKCIAQMIAFVKDQSRTEKDKFTKILADTRKYLKAGCDLNKKMCELDKKLNNETLLKILQKLADSTGKLTTEPIPAFSCVQYTDKSATENDIKQLFGTFKICDERIQQTRDCKEKKEKPKSEYRPDKETKKQEQYIYACTSCGEELLSDTWV